MSDNIYFAAKEADKTAQALITKANNWYNQLHENGYLRKLEEMWMAYYGTSYTSFSGAHKISFTGEQGELVQMTVNHMRNICTHMLTMITSSRPAFQARASNKDYKSLVQTRLANDLLDYYLREKRLERYLKDAVESAIVMGSGFIKMDWNSTTGEVYDYNEETGAPVYEGDVEFTNLSPFDVVFDTSKENRNHDWVLCRTFKNKYDLAAKYPENGDKIKGLRTKSEYQTYRLASMSSDETDDVPVYEFYHKQTESLPDGRYLLFLDDGIILMDGPIPYRRLPVYRIAPSDIMGTPFGYTPMFDLLPLQNAIDSLYSTVLTNQHAFGVQNVYIPRGADVSFKALEGGLNLIEGNAGAGKPESLNLTQTPKEIFDFLKILEQQMETISGISSVTRGNPEASLKSGSALALVQSMSLQFISGLQGQYVQLIEDVGTGLINMLQDFASVPRIATIAGKLNRAYIEQEFTGDDLSEVNRVIVDVGNPLAKTTSGKLQIANDLIQYGLVKTPEQYFTILTTGQLNPITDDAQDTLTLIQGENERMAEGKAAKVLAIDQHLLHVKGHRSVLSDPQLREDEALTELVLEHIEQHINFLRNVDPALLSIIGEQPLGPVGGTPPAPGAGQMDPNMSAPPQNAAMAPPPGPGELPGMPQMPQTDPSLLPNPAAEQQMALPQMPGGIGS